MSNPSGPSDADERTGVPRWVKVSAIVVAVVVLIVTAVRLMGGGGHEIPDHGDGGNAPTSSASPEGHTPPPGAHD